MKSFSRLSLVIAAVLLISACSSTPKPAPLAPTKIVPGKPGISALPGPGVAPVSRSQPGAVAALPGAPGQLVVPTQLPKPSTSKGTVSTKPATVVTTKTVVPAKTVAVSIKDSAFSPASITINAGDTVIWTNKDALSHSIAGKDITGGSSSPLKTNSSFSQKFTKAGVFSYSCGIHPSMKGTVTVK